MLFRSELFDAPDANGCYRRTRSVVPQQALALTNSDLIHTLSESLAQSLGEQLAASPERTAGEEGATTKPLIVAAYEQILSRPPTPDELATCVEFMATQQALIGTQHSDNAIRRAAASLVRVLFNHNDFVGIR